MRFFVIIAISLLLTGNAYAWFDDNSTNADASASSSAVLDNDNTLIGVNTNTNRNTNTQGQGQDQEQGQLQGQMMGQGQTMGQDQIGEVTTVVDEHNKAYAYGAPSTVAGEGQQASSIYSIFGGVNLAQSEEAKTCMDNINVIAQLATNGFLSKEEAKQEALAQFAQLKDATKSKRLLGILWKTRGVHLLNGFGLLAWDDLPSKLPQAKEKTIDEDLSGNLGYIE